MIQGNANHFFDELHGVQKLTTYRPDQSFMRIETMGNVSPAAPGVPGDFRWVHGYLGEKDASAEPLSDRPPECVTVASTEGPDVLR
jgi:hypothetical protein